MFNFGFMTEAGFANSDFFLYLCVRNTKQSAPIGFDIIVIRAVWSSLKMVTCRYTEFERRFLFPYIYYYDSLAIDDLVLNRSFI